MTHFNSCSMYKVRLTHNNHNQINKFDRSIFLANKKECQYCSFSLSLFLFGMDITPIVYITTVSQVYKWLRLVVEKRAFNFFFLGGKVLFGSHRMWNALILFTNPQCWTAFLQNFFSSFKIFNQKTFFTKPHGFQAC